MFTKVRYWRYQRGLSIKALYEKAGVGPNTIMRLERGNVCRLVTLLKIANALEIPLWALFALESDADRDRVEYGPKLRRQS